MSVAAGELARWQGRIETRVAEVEKRTDALGELNQTISLLRVDIATLRTQLRFWSAVGGALMAGLVTLAVTLLTRGT